MGIKVDTLVAVGIVASDGCRDVLYEEMVIQYEILGVDEFLGILFHGWCIHLYLKIRVV
jgi:hypothetical protein